jgi:hypothetical protein
MKVCLKEGKVSEIKRSKWEKFREGGRGNEWGDERGSKTCSTNMHSGTRVVSKLPKACVSLTVC